MKLSRHINRVLILGASGKVGRMLTRFWVQSPPNDWVVFPQVRHGASSAEINWSLGDGPSLLKPATAVVVLWGASPGSGLSFGENERLGLAALEIARDIGADRVFLASSAAVYGGAEIADMTEGTKNLLPSGEYGQSKLAMENAAALWAKRHPDGPAVCCLRISNVVGGDSLFASLAGGSSIVLDRFPSGGGPRRSYITPSDLARTIDRLVKLPVHDVPRILNIAGARPVSMEDMAEAAGADVTWRPAPDSALECVAMDTSCLACLTGALEESADAVQAIAAWKKVMKDA